MASLRRPIDDLIRLALGLGPYHPGEKSPWSHTFLIAAPYAGSKTPILDCTIRDSSGKVPWNESLDDLLRGGITRSGGIYNGVVEDYDDPRVTSFGLKLLPSITTSERQRIVAEGRALQAAGYHYDIPGLVRELVRLLIGIAIPAGDHLLFCSAFCQAAYRNALATQGDFAPAIRTADITPDDIWHSSVGEGFLPPSSAPPAPHAAIMAAVPAGPTPAETAIEHIVVLMLENRSFDSMLGALGLQSGSRVDGIKPGLFNPAGDGSAVKAFLTTRPILRPDPHHDFDSVAQQLSSQNSGFVKNYESFFAAKDRPKASAIMGYFDQGTLPVLYALAQEYAISDSWFCSVPSETWPNRLFAHAASSDGHVANGLPGFLTFYDLPTIYDRLGNALSDWAIYNEQLPQSICIRSLKNEWLRSRHRADSHFRSISPQFYDDCASGSLPKYSFIEPTYFGGKANDDHPPHDVWLGQQLIADIYHALRASPLWPKSLLVIVYDEHGGIHDHVPPPKNVPPPDGRPANQNQLGFDFRSLGPRVPCVLVSPWARKGAVVHPPAGGFFDHTSILATVARKWSLQPLTDRDGSASDLWAALDMSAARTDDDATFTSLTDWKPPASAVPQSLLMAARNDLAAPVPDLNGASGREAAGAIVQMANTRAVLASTVGIAEAQPELSEFQESLTDLARAVLDAK